MYSASVSAADKRVNTSSASYNSGYANGKNDVNITSQKTGYTYTTNYETVTLNFDSAPKALLLINFTYGPRTTVAWTPSLGVIHLNSAGKPNGSLTVSNGNKTFVSVNGGQEKDEWQWIAFF